MNNAMKGLVLSGLIFPGIGQVALKQYRRGIIFITAATAGLVLFAWKAVLIAWQVMAAISTNGTVANPEQLMADTAGAVAAADWSGLWWGVFLMVAAWLTGTVDAYLVGRNLDRMSSHE